MSNVFNRPRAMNIPPTPLPIKGIRKEVVNHFKVQYSFGDFILHSTRVLFHKDRKISVSPKELGVLILLLESAGEVVSKDRLINEVWSGGNVGEESLTRCIYVLRRILQEGKHNRFIDTVYGKGYRFTLPVTRVTPRERMTTASCIFAVLPFHLDAHLDTLELHDAIVQEMTGYAAAGLHVLPSSLTLGCTSLQTTLELMEKIKPDYYLTGYQLSQTSGPLMRVELMRAQDHLVLHREAINLDGRLTVACINRRIKPLLLKHIPCLREDGQTLNPPSSTLDARAVHRAGRDAFLAYTPESLGKALDLLQQGRRQAPDDIDLQYHLAECYFALGQMGMMDFDHALRECGALIDGVLARTADHPEALALSGVLQGLNRAFSEAAERFKQALAMSGDNPSVNYYYAWHLLIVGDTGRALYFARQARKMLPEMMAVQVLMMWLEYCDGNAQAALDIAGGQSPEERAHPVLLSMRAVILCSEGQPGRAAELIPHLMNGSEQDGIVYLNALYTRMFSQSAAVNGEQVATLMRRATHMMPSALLPVILQCQGYRAAKKWYDQLSSTSSPCLMLWRNDPRVKPLRAEVPEC
ncbi:winged helix-turn-helix domain-containing protein [Sodalis sp. RH24]|uniref:winged helix-turn-helix domain-containing protein n=1 Tax=unclassified Sodalis (in: enterobacteria) TaxID=2636512 RepID=UPI0039659289